MTMSPGFQSAKIIKFPARAGARLRSFAEEAKAAADPASAPVFEGASGSGWYHEAAIREADQNAKG
ncbi:DUF2735 domain-containing protein [Skermanella mucosa]|uniref:DUF2735 domain-containing protein n=1 Tax=Skermanella mucosa TaxID=1789672 RepID=UPI00192BEA8D|nr:DUF2735 domain-containing protein [Skermanella mucosa]UEM19080.1 DUF2735 domain-containing protein [Skermanella mucosa]